MTAMRAIPVEIDKVTNNIASSKLDVVAAEEPLEIRLGFGPTSDRAQKSLAVTMRTPGHDFELALGFLFTEGIIQDFEDAFHIDHCTDSNGDRSENVVRVELRPEIELDWGKLQRNFYTTSSCGICGKASIESLQNYCPAPIQCAYQLEPEVVHSLGNTMRQEQSIFEYTGGLHAAALFDCHGKLLVLREDIGRHNALDKVIGTAIFQNRLPLSDCIIMLSGRCCFELVQKSLMAGIPTLVSVGAPSSLAVQTAIEFNLCLVGFARTDGFNVYSTPERLNLKKN